MKKLILSSLIAAFFVVGCVESKKPKFQEDWDSLAKHEPAAEWFRDAKFGIYFHWGVYTVPAYGNEWYPHWMMLEGGKWGRVYDHHLKTYGGAEKYPYHKFVPQFKGEKFNADEWVSLFSKAGARFAGLVAEHHDGYAMWPSKATPWNSMERGLKRDVVGEIAKAVRAHDMNFITTFHHARNLQRYKDKPEEFDRTDIEKHRRFWLSHYPYIPGTAVVSEDSELSMLYGNMPEDEWLERMWFGKLKEVVDAYQPDLIYFDSWLDQIPESYRKKFAAYYFNDADKRGKEVIIARKQDDLPLSFTIDDLEQDRKDSMSEEAWMTDATLSTRSWSYTEDLKLHPAKRVIHILADIVSKNGCLLLNVSPKSDGTIPQDQQDVLLEIGEWLKINGEAIYSTRPWYVAAEGPTLGKGKYTFEDIRYTRSKDGKTVYAIVLGWPGANKDVVMTEFAKVDSILEISNVSMLGSEQEIKWDLSDEGLKITTPDKQVSELAIAFIIELR